MLIAQISDTHILGDDSDHPSAGLRSAWLERCVEGINQHAPDAVLFTGDTTQHGQPGEYERLFGVLSNLDAPLYMVPGNRDDQRTLRDVLGHSAHDSLADDFFNYTVETHEVRLVGLDSTAPGERKGVFGPSRLAWLDAVLSQQPERPTVLFIHHPPFDVSDHYIGGYRRNEEAAAMGRLVSGHPQVAALICGHVHWLVEQEWAGTQARIMPSVAVDLRKGIDEEQAAGRPIFMLHQLNGDQLSSSAIQAE